MKAFKIGTSLVCVVSFGGLLWQWTVANRLRSENEALRAELNVARAEMAQPAAPEPEAVRSAEASATELARLRAEVATLRAAAKELETTKARAAQLQAQNQQLRSKAEGSPTAAAPSAPVTADSFPRESWAFAGYGSPEAALVSAIWSMREGNPKTYLEGLSPEEQARMSQVWGNKPEAEIAAKHQSDVSKITSFRIVDRQEVSPEQVVMSVYIGGVERLERVSMRKVGTDWKFGGFVREASQ
jgi:hypothetical protein